MSCLALDTRLKSLYSKNQLFQEELHRSKKAEFNSVTSAPRSACTEGTRKEILEDLMKWANDDSARPIFWMNGMAGTGKTTIAYSFCQQLMVAKRLGASFFSSRSEDETADPSRVLPTIAYQLSRQSPAFSSALLASLENDEVLGRTPLESQFQRLILRPAKVSAAELRHKQLAIVCDGLDECKRLIQMSEILSLWIQHALELPIRFFISSRPEAEITSNFLNTNFSNHERLLLHRVEDHFVRRDIEIFVRYRFREIRTTRSFGDGWPSEDQIKKLLDLSGTLFIYAATVCLFVGDPTTPTNTTQAALGTILSYNSTKKTSSRSYTSLDELYTVILSGAYKKTGKDFMQDVLRVIVVSQTALSEIAIRQLLNPAADSAEIVDLARALISLRSVILIPNDISQPVQIFHASFPDFLADSSRSHDHHLSTQQSHQFLAYQCLKLLAHLLSKDICQLRHKNEQGSQADTKKYISEALEYACINWITHYLESEDLTVLEKLIDIFFQQLALHWVECMALIGKLDIAVSMLQKLEFSASALTYSQYYITLA